MSGSFLREIEVLIRRDLSPEQAAQHFAEVARKGLAADIAAHRVPSRYERYVDGVKGAPETAVKPGGAILYEFSYMAEVVVFALGFLRGRSPQSGGAVSGPRLYRLPYRESFYVAVDGKFISPGEFQPELVPGTAEIVIGNVQPYSRKLDVQLIGRRPLRFSVPPGLFQDAARAVNRQFGNFAQAKRVYTMQFPGQWRLKQAQYRTGTESHRMKRGAGELVESPALVIKPR